MEEDEGYLGSDSAGGGEGRGKKGTCSALLLRTEKGATAAAAATTSGDDDDAAEGVDGIVEGEGDAIVVYLALKRSQQREGKIEGGSRQGRGECFVYGMFSAQRVCLRWLCLSREVRVYGKEEEAVWWRGGFTEATCMEEAAHNAVDLCLGSSSDIRLRVGYSCAVVYRRANILRPWSAS